MEIGHGNSAFFQPPPLALFFSFQSFQLNSDNSAHTFQSHSLKRVMTQVFPRSNGPFPVNSILFLTEFIGKS